jgi:hypothetical protein
MAKLWNMTGDIAVMDALSNLEDHYEPPRFSFENRLRLVPWDTKMMARYFVWPGSIAPDPPPEPLRLRLTEPGIAPNYIDLGFTLASATARAAMAVDDYVSWFRVDASASTDEVLAQDYRMMLVNHAATAFDPQRSSGKIITCSAEYGLPSREMWYPGPIDFDKPPPAFHWLEDFEPPAPIFYERLTNRILVTEDFAQRIEDSGISGFTFIDYEYDGTETEIKLRSA